MPRSMGIQVLKSKLILIIKTNLYWFLLISNDIIIKQENKRVCLFCF